MIIRNVIIRNVIIRNVIIRNVIIRNVYYHSYIYEIISNLLFIKIQQCLQNHKPACSLIRNHSYTTISQTFYQSLNLINLSKCTIIWNSKIKRQICFISSRQMSWPIMRKSSFSRNSSISSSVNSPRWTRGRWMQKILSTVFSHRITSRETIYFAMTMWLRIGSMPFRTIWRTFSRGNLSCLTKMHRKRWRESKSPRILWLFFKSQISPTMR